MSSHRTDAISFARSLRRRMTRAETLLWNALRRNGVAGLHFRRQAPVGRYIADFLCASEKLIVELDGAPHEKDEQQIHDRIRDAWLARAGYTVLRLQNDLVIGGGNLALERIVAEVERIRAEGKARTLAPSRLAPPTTLPR